VSSDHRECAWRRGAPANVWYGEALTFLLSLAYAFALALLLGRLMSRLRLPRATAYLMVGVLVGEPVLGSLPMVDPLIVEGPGLGVIVDFTLGLILFGIGRRFRLQQLRRNLGRILAIAATEISVTFVLVAGVGFAVGASIQTAVLLGIIGVATAPAATILVIREYESEGPTTDLSVLLIGINNLVSVIAFIVVVGLILPGDVAASRPHVVFAIAMPLGVGLGVGLVTSVWDARVDKLVERQLLGIAAIAGIVGMAEAYEFNALLACLVAGIVVVNASPRETALFDALHEVDYPLYVLFFVLAGTRLHTENLVHLGLVGIAYVVARTGGKLLGATLAARWFKLGGQGNKWLGFALLAQAGVAIGLSRTLAEIWPEVGGPIEATVLAGVVVFEIVGPPVVRTALVRSGEVKVMTLLVRRAPVGLFEGAHQVVDHFRRAIGIPAWRKLAEPGDIPIAQLMRKNVETIPTGAHLDEVLRQLAATRYDRLLVVTPEGKLAGVINYADVGSVVVDDTLSQLVTASDIASTSPVTLREDATVADAMDVLQRHPDMSFLPVIASDDSHRLLGIVRQNDVLGTFRKMR